jgi:4-hydroxybenzoate polyprenyltransferase
MNPSRLRALLATLRIANMPSVICNVWLGIVISQFFQPRKPFAEHAGTIAFIIASALLLYAGGNLLNDWKDRSWDQSHRPERALPRGLFSPSSYIAAAVSCFAFAIVFAYSNSDSSALIAALIVVNILIYTHWHKRHAWTVIPMGLCRALLPLMAFLAFRTGGIEIPPNHFSLLYDLPYPFVEKYWPIIASASWILPHSLAIFFYIIGLTLSARAESNPAVSHGMAWIARTLIVTSVLSMALCWMPGSPRNTAIALIPCTFWLILSFTVLRKPVSKHVSALLAGLPLLDGIALFTYASLWTITFSEKTPWILLTCLILPPIAFLTGRLLQRVAPAT